MYTLYYSPGVCSMSVHVTLEELGLDFEAKKVDLSKGEHKEPEYLKINPRGQVGALQTPGGIISENAAMIVYLNDEHEGELIPQAGYARAQALQWLMYANSTMHPAYAKALFAKKNEASDEIMKTACDGIQDQWNLVEGQLEQSGGPYLMGEHFGPGDIYLAVVANWKFIPHLPKFGEKTKKFLKTVTARPSFQAVLEREGVDYKAI